MIWRGFDTDATGIQSEPRLLGIDIKCSRYVISLFSDYLHGVTYTHSFKL